MSLLHATFALRRCYGCERLLGVRWWPWTGRWLVVTHGLCADCSRELKASLAELSRVEGDHASRAGAPPGALH